MRPKADIADNQRLELYSLQLLLLSLLLSTRRRGSLDIFSHDVLFKAMWLMTVLDLVR